MDPDRTGVVTFEVSKLDNFWWKVEIFELLLNVKHNIFFQLTGKLASKWQRSRKPHSCHIRTKGSLGEVLLSGTGFQFVLSLDFIWFYYSVFILFSGLCGWPCCFATGKVNLCSTFKMERFALMNVAEKIWKWTCEHFCRLSKTKISTWTLQEKYGNGLVFFADYQKQKNQHEMVWAHECCRKIWKLTFCGLSRKLTCHT